VRPPGAPTTAGRSGKGVLVRARSEQNRWLEELGVIRRVEEAGMMDQNRFDSYKAHHSFISTLGRRQVFEKWRRYGGSIKPISVVRDSFREEQLLQPLLVIKRGLHPEV
jgi:hypothetical protein